MTNIPEPPAGDPWCRHGNFCNNCDEAFIDTYDRGVCRKCRGENQ